MTGQGAGESAPDVEVDAEEPGPTYFVMRLEKQLRFRAFKDTGELLVYRDGAYCAGAEALIEEEVENHHRKKLTAVAKRNLVAEVVASIRRAGYADRADFNPPGRLCLLNGIFDLETETLSPHSPDVLFTAQMPVTYDPTATCPRWLKFIDEVQPTYQGAHLLQLMIGYILEAGNRFQVAELLLGTGNNGKETLLATIEAILGPGNVSSQPLQAFEGNRFALAELAGKLANIRADLPAVPLKDTSLFKALRSGKLLTAEKKNQHPFQFRFRGKLIFSANQLPETADHTYGYWRSWVAIRFSVDFTGREDRTLREQLRAELSGILNWMLAGMRLLKHMDRFPTESSTASIVEEWREQNDSLYTFVKESVVKDPKGEVDTDTFELRYADFCGAHGTVQKGRAQVGREIRALIPGVTRADRRLGNSRWRVWTGIRWREPADLEDGQTRLPSGQGRSPDTSDASAAARLTSSSGADGPDTSDTSGTPPGTHRAESPREDLDVETGGSTGVAGVRGVGTAACENCGKPTPLDPVCTAVSGFVSVPTVGGRLKRNLVTSTSSETRPPRTWSPTCHPNRSRSGQTIARASVVHPFRATVGTGLGVRRVGRVTSRADLGGGGRRTGVARRRARVARYQVAPSSHRHRTGRTKAAARTSSGGRDRWTRDATPVRQHPEWPRGRTAMALPPPRGVPGGLGWASNGSGGWR